MACVYKLFLSSILCLLFFSSWIVHNFIRKRGCLRKRQHFTVWWSHLSNEITHKIDDLMKELFLSTIYFLVDWWVFQLDLATMSTSFFLNCVSVIFDSICSIFPEKVRVLVPLFTKPTVFARDWRKPFVSVTWIFERSLLKVRGSAP